MECQKFEERHTGQNIADDITRCLEEKKITNDKIVCATTDNAKNVKKGIKILGFNHLAGFAHTLALVVMNSILKKLADDTFAFSMLKDVRDKIAELVEMLKRNSVLKDDFFLCQEQCGYPKILMMLQDVTSKYYWLTFKIRDSSIR